MPDAYTQLQQNLWNEGNELSKEEAPDYFRAWNYDFAFFVAEDIDDANLYAFIASCQ